MVVCNRERGKASWRERNLSLTLKNGEAECANGSGSARTWDRVTKAGMGEAQRIGAAVRSVCMKQGREGKGEEEMRVV